MNKVARLAALIGENTVTDQYSYTVKYADLKIDQKKLPKNKLAYYLLQLTSDIVQFEVLRLIQTIRSPVIPTPAENKLKDQTESVATTL